MPEASSSPEYLKYEPPTEDDECVLALQSLCSLRLHVLTPSPSAPSQLLPRDRRAERHVHRALQGPRRRLDPGPADGPRSEGPGRLAARVYRRARRARADDVGAGVNILRARVVERLGRGGKPPGDAGQGPTDDRHRLRSEQKGQGRGVTCFLLIFLHLLDGRARLPEIPRFRFFTLLKITRFLRRVFVLTSRAWYRAHERTTESGCGIRRGGRRRAKVNLEDGAEKDYGATRGKARPPSGQELSDDALQYVDERVRICMISRERRVGERTSPFDLPSLKSNLSPILTNCIKQKARHSSVCATSSTKKVREKPKDALREQRQTRKRPCIDLQSA